MAPWQEDHFDGMQVKADAACAKEELRHLKVRGRPSQYSVLVAERGEARPGLEIGAEPARLPAPCRLIALGERTEALELACDGSSVACFARDSWRSSNTRVNRFTVARPSVNSWSIVVPVLAARSSAF